MAWLQNLADKAENLLNKIDKNAANVLSENNLSNKLLDNMESNLSDPHIMEPPQENVYFRECESLKKSSDSNSANNIYKTSFEDSVTTCDNASIISEKSSKYSDDDNGITFITPHLNKLDNDGNDTITKRDSKLDVSLPLKSNSFIAPDEDTIEKYEEMLSNLELENQALNKQLLKLQHLYSELQNENSNLQSQLERSNDTVLSAQREMEQYKMRAQRILQEKEKLIACKENYSSGNEQENVMTFYNEELKKELEFQQDKNRELVEKLQSANMEMGLLQKQYVQLQNTVHTTNQNMQEAFSNECKIRSALEEECHLKSKLQNIFQDLTKTQVAIETQKHEIAELKQQLKQKHHFETNVDAESRIRSLTHTLISKQSSLESVTTERNALRLQLEKIENEYHKLSVQLQNNQVKIDVNVEKDEVKSYVPQFLRISPFDAGVTRRVKHAYSTLDSISVRTGVFLRRYPLARVFVFCYMVLLHIWVLIILFTYIPNNR